MKPITLTLTKPHANNYNAYANYLFIQLIIKPILWNHEHMPGTPLYTGNIQGDQNGQKSLSAPRWHSSSF